MQKNSTPPLSKGDRDKSFWRTIPGIVAEVTALITAVGGIITILYATGIIGVRSTPSNPPPGETLSPDRVSVSRPPLPLPTNTSATTPDDCLLGYFQGIRKDNVFALEEGASAHVLIGREKTKEDPTGIQLSDDRQIVGAIRLSYVHSGEIFKIESVVDSSCRQVHAYTVEGRPGEKRLLQNWDTIHTRLGSRTYALRLGVGGGELSVTFVRFVP